MARLALLSLAVAIDDPFTAAASAEPFDTGFERPETITGLSHTGGRIEQSTNTGQT